MTVQDTPKGPPRRPTPRLKCRGSSMRVRARGTLAKNKSRSRSRNHEKRPRCIRLLPIFCIFIIIMALGIVALSEISLVDRRGMPKVIGGAGTAARIMPGRMRQKPQPQPPPPPPKKHGRELTFKMEALIRRNALSMELFAQMTLNKFRADYIADIISRESVKVKRYHTPYCSKVSDDCPPSPPDLEGRKDLDQWMHGAPAAQIIRRRVRSGGTFVSESCVSRHLVAIVIPYRDRESQLNILLNFIHPFLQSQQLNYRIFVVEQAGNDTFNKGVLMNAGFLTSFEYPIYRGVPYHCVIFHDVDLLPEDDRNMYTCPQQPRHLSVAVDELNYILPYRILAGGAFAIRTDHFFKVNGYSNLFWGWGGEDDDMGYRVENVHASISRPPERIARYTMIKHPKRRSLALTVKASLLRTSSRRFRLDGLNTVQYTLQSVNIYPLYTHLLVDVGPSPYYIKALQDAEEHWEY